MTNPQHPQQPGWDQNQQPTWAGQQPGWGVPPQPPKKPSAGKIVGLGCLGVLALVVILGIGGALAGSGSSTDAGSGSGDVKVTAPDTSHKPAADKAAAKAKKPAPKPKKKVVTFKVWGNAPAGALGSLDITYGSDSDNRQGHWRNGGFEATLPLNNKAMWYTVTAQLQGSGDIHCSVTVDGHTKKGHAAGGYNICDAQLDAGLFGGWS